MQHFGFRPRKKPLIHFVIHESVSTSVASTNRTLDRKRAKTGYDFGIHFNIAPDGCIYQHNDPVTERLVQANYLNDSSAGVEVTTPYNPKFGGAPWTRVIAGPWWCWKPRNAEKVYSVPTRVQLAATMTLCRMMARYCTDLPWEFPTQNLNARKTRIDGWREKVAPGPGIIAHRDFASHADGRYLLEHVINSPS